MNTKLQELKLHLDVETSLKEQIADAMAEFKEKNAWMYAKLEGAQSRIAECKAVLTESAKAGFLVDGLKSREGGLGIRVMNTIEYDEDVALSWAKDHNLCLSLDVKSFKSLAKTQDFDFVKHDERVSVTFPKVIDVSSEEVAE